MPSPLLCRLVVPLLLACLLAASPVALAQGLPTARPETVGVSAERLARIRPVTQGFVDRGQISGVVTLIARNGKVVHLDTVGMSDPAAKTPMRADTLFRVASMTKPVTSVAVMMLCEQGRLLLTDPVSKYLPEFEEMKVAVEGSPDAAGKRPVTLEPAARAITIKDLLTHRSGLTYGIFDRGPVGEAYRKAGVSDGVGTGDLSLAENIARIAAQPLVHQPGARWNYGLSTDVLGRLVEVVSGQTLDRFFREQIFTPLRMNDTAFYVPDDKLPRLAALAVPPGAGGTPPNNGNALRGSRSYFSGGAGLVSTAGDYARFLQMLLNGGELDGVRLLSPKSVELMTVSHTGDLSPSPLGNGNGFGLGFAVITDLGQTAALGSTGAYSWGGYFGTSFWVDPKEKLIGILLIQRMPTGELGLAERFKTLAYQAITK
jgi:CubicO group peptidase (beta-lactamase class C family)